MSMEKAMKAEHLPESIETIGEKVAQTAEDLKEHSEAMLREGERILRRTAKEVKAEFDRHPVAMIVAGAAVAGALIWFLTKK